MRTNVVEDRLIAKLASKRKGTLPAVVGARAVLSIVPRPTRPNIVTRVYDTEGRKVEYEVVQWGSTRPYFVDPPRPVPPFTTPATIKKITAPRQPKTSDLATKISASRNRFLAGGPRCAAQDDTGVARGHDARPPERSHNQEESRMIARLDGTPTTIDEFFDRLPPADRQLLENLDSDTPLSQAVIGATLDFSQSRVSRRIKAVGEQARRALQSTGPDINTVSTLPLAHQEKEALDVRKGKYLNLDNTRYVGPKSQIRNVVARLSPAALVERIRQNARDRDAREQLMLAHRPLAMKTARHYAAKSHQSLEDVKQVCLVGLMNARDSFNPAKGRFSTQARYTMMTALRQAYGSHKKVR